MKNSPSIGDGPVESTGAAGCLRHGLYYRSSTTILNPMVNFYELDRTFAALSDPTRRGMIATLAGGPQTISALAQPYSMSLVAASKHITVLERAGLLRRSRAGRSQVCTLEPAALRAATRWLDRYRTFWTGQLDALDTFLATEPDTAPGPDHAVEAS